MKLHDENFDRIVSSLQNTSTSLLFSFSIPMCEYCRQLSPMFSDLASKMTTKNVLVGTIDCSLNKLTCLRFPNTTLFPKIALISYSSKPSSLVYFFQGDRRSAQDITLFATGGFRGSKSMEFPKPLNSFDLLILKTLEIWNNKIEPLSKQYAVLMVPLFFVFGLILGCFVFSFGSSSSSEQQQRRRSQPPRSQQQTRQQSQQQFVEKEQTKEKEEEQQQTVRQRQTQTQHQEQLTEKSESSPSKQSKKQQQQQSQTQQQSSPEKQKQKKKKEEKLKE